MIIESDLTLDAFRGRGQCSGGRLDVPINLLSMGMPMSCACHDNQHTRNDNPSTADLLWLVSMREGERACDVEQVMHLLGRLPGKVVNGEVVKPTQHREYVEAAVQDWPRSARRLLGRVMRECGIWKKVKR
jgi:hypothetical protein